MKYKMLAVVLALTVMSWAQNTTQTVPSTPEQNSAPADKAKCPCCDKMAGADAKDSHASCMRHEMKAGKEGMGSCCAGKNKDAASCCGGKDAKSCISTDKDKTAASCCKDGCGKDKTAAACCGAACGKDGEKNCCSSKKTEKAAKSCCGDDLRSEEGTVPTFAQSGK